MEQKALQHTTTNSAEPLGAYQPEGRLAEDGLKAFVKRNAPFAVPVVRGAKAGVLVARQLGSKQKVKRLLRERNEILVEIGAGDKKGERGWITLDVTKNCDVCWDLRKGLPFPHETINTIYSSHLFEHLTFQEGQRLLDECKRALVPGGLFSICVPNARLYMQAYLSPGVLDSNRFFGYQAAYNNTTKIDYVNYVGHLDGHHKYMFDEENLLFLLESKGFRNARLRPFDPKLDLEERDFESIYAEAEK